MNTIIGEVPEIAPEIAALDCEQCRNHFLGEACVRDGVGYGTQYFEWAHFNYRIDIAQAILIELPRRAIPLDKQAAIGCGLPISDEPMPEGQKRFVNEAHLAHLPKEMVELPGIVCPAIEKPGTDEARAAWLLLDGGHRLTKRFRDGAADVLVWPLTIVESLLCAGLSVAEAQAYTIRNKRAFYHFSPDELNLAGIFPVEESDEDSRVLHVVRNSPTDVFNKQ